MRHPCSRALRQEVSRWQGARRRAGDPDPLSTINPHAAGIDIGATLHVVAVPARPDRQPVRTFRTFSGDLHQLADWLARGRHHDRRDGVDGRVLDSCLRDPRGARLRGRCSSTRATSSTCRAARRTSMTRSGSSSCTSMGCCAAASARARRRPAARLPAPSRAAGRVRGGAHSAHAEGADADECAAAPRVTDITGVTGHAHHPRDRRGQSRARACWRAIATCGAPPRRRPSARRSRATIGRARLRAAAGARALRLPSGQDRRVRRGDRSASCGR